MKRGLIAAAIAIPILILGSLFAHVIYTGPRMTVQPHIRAFQVVAPLPPEGSVTVNPPEVLPSAENAALIKNPLQATDDNISRGTVYYHYYCAFCHGDQGGGNGPVGESYIPVPADLRAPKIGNMPDGSLLRAMLTGMGHGPVMERVVPPRHRWPLVLYVRGLGMRQTTAR